MGIYCGHGSGAVTTAYWLYKTGRNSLLRKRSSGAHYLVADSIGMYCNLAALFYHSSFTCPFGEKNKTDSGHTVQIIRMALKDERVRYLRPLQHSAILLPLPLGY